jgi:hypothetical protein
VVGEVAKRHDLALSSADNQLPLDNGFAPRPGEAVGQMNQPSASAASVLVGLPKSSVTKIAWRPW